MVQNTWFSWCSEEVVILGALNLVIIFAKGFPDIIRIESILGSTLLLGASISLCKYFSAGKMIFLEHFDCKNVIDLDIMSRHAVLKEVGWEHHAVASIPEFWLILLVECENITVSNETELGQDHGSCHPPHKDTRVIEWSILHTNEPCQVLTLQSHNLVHHYPVIVDDLCESEETVMAILPFSNSEELE